MQKLLGGRYEVDLSPASALGAGGMAEVFRGRDVRLGRTVAVKVLRSDLARDASFQQRFRREAQAAAALSAPSVVSVYDTGQDDDGTPYIVMEYVDGRTLRAVLQTEGRLLPQRALEVAADVCEALDVAHAAGIVHRDIKPGNVMLTPSGDVKVMDFGIARAAADSTATVTQTANVIGTAAYLSPEQARGEHVDARSDVYSTGCMLYELLTGSPPFSGDNPVAVAYQHVREEPVPPSEYDDSLPSALAAVVDAVVLKAMAKAPEERYQSASEMRDDLLRAAAGQPVAAAQQRAAAVHATTALPLAAGAAAVGGPQPDRGRWLLGGFVAACVLVALGVMLLVRTLASDERELVKAPALTGRSQEQAVMLLSQSGLRVGEVTQQFSDERPGTVIEQEPVAGIVVPLGGEVDIAVSKGVEMAVVPNVVGASQQEATALLEAAKLVVDVIERDGNFPAGQVLAQLPDPGSRVRAGTKVRLVVASGEVEVPDVRGRTRDEAVALLQRAGFDVGIELQDSDGPEGVVLDQSPVSTTAPRGSTVVITVSRRPQPTAEPSPSDEPFPTADPFPTDEPTPEA